jgi:predicted MPP superfamily phosphohydrolase
MMPDTVVIAPPLCSRAEWRRQRAAREATPVASTVIGLRPRRSRLHRLKDPGIPWVLKSLGLQGRALANARDLRLRVMELGFPTLPAAFDGYTLLHLSDPHVGMVEGVLERAVALVGAHPVDLVILTGDVQTNGWPAAPAAARRLEPLLAAIRSRDGIVAVLGNHDHHTLPDALERLGVRVLINGHAMIVRGSERIHLAGTDDVNCFFTEDAVRLLEAAPAGFVVALVHSPELADVAARTGHALYLSGHTHGGQIVLPGGRALFTATRRLGWLAAGLWRLGAMQGYTSTGIGTGLVRARFNCPPEMALIRLRCRPPGGPGR